MKKLINIVLLTLAICSLAGCGTMERAEIQPDGSVVWIPIMRVRSFARDFDYTETISDTNGIIKSVRYSSKGTTASVIGAGAQLMGAAASMSPF